MDTLFIGTFAGDSPESLANAAQRGGTDSRFATTTKEAMSALLDAPPRLALVDAGMPGVEALLAQVRREGATFGVPMALQVATASDLTFTEAHAIGADDAFPRGDLGAVTRRVANLRTFDPTQRPEAAAGTAILAHPDARRRCLLGRVLRQAGFFVRFAQDNLELQTAASADPKLLVVSSELEGFDPAAVANLKIPTVLMTAAKDRLDLRDKAPGCAVAVEGAPPDQLLFFANELLRAELQDVRASRRMLHESICVFRPAGDLHGVHGLTYNISGGGLYVRTLDPPSRGTKVWLELRPPAATEAVHLRGEVVWRSPFPGGATPPGFGVQLREDECPPTDLASYVAGYEMLERL